MLGSAYVPKHAKPDDVQMHVSQQKVQYFDFTASHSALTSQDAATVTGP